MKKYLIPTLIVIGIAIILIISQCNTCVLSQLFSCKTSKTVTTSEKCASCSQPNPPKKCCAKKQ